MLFVETFDHDPVISVRKRCSVKQTFIITHIRHIFKDGSLKKQMKKKGLWFLGAVLIFLAIPFVQRSFLLDAREWLTRREVPLTGKAADIDISESEVPPELSVREA